MRRTGWIAGVMVLAACGGAAEKGIEGPAPETAAAPAGGAATSSTVPAGAGLTDARATELGRRYATWLYANRVDSLWTAFDADMKAQSESPEHFGTLMHQAFEVLGQEKEVLKEEIVDAEDLRVYRRVASWSGIPQHVALTFALHPDGTIAGIFFRPGD